MKGREMKFTGVQLTMSSDIASLLSLYCRPGAVADGLRVPLDIPATRPEAAEASDREPAPVTPPSLPAKDR